MKAEQVDTKVKEKSKKPPWQLKKGGKTKASKGPAYQLWEQFQVNESNATTWEGVCRRSLDVVRDWDSQTEFGTLIFGIRKWTW
jgi:hypothetical protein